ncbi:MAG: AbrB family transcriptional regulator [Thermoprotei archaeon]|nr:MAG: AbrB family transcriptional regulator [Thermoprotei archaeon]
MISYIVKVTRKGQVTIPKNIRVSLGIEEGELLQVSLEKGKIIITKLGVPSPGEPIGREEYEKIIKELERERANWR